MTDSISPIRQVAAILPKVSAQYDVQERLIPNGNKVIEIVDQAMQAKKLRQVTAIEPSYKVTVRRQE